MAFKSSGYELIAQAVDQGANKVPVKWRLYQNPILIIATPATVYESLGAKIVADYAKLTDAKIISYSLNSLYNENTGPFIGASGSEVEERATLSLLIDTSGTTGSGEIKYGIMHIVAPKDALFLGASGPEYNIVKKDYADLLTYLGNFTYSAVAPFGAISDLEPIASPTVAGNFKGGKRTHRGSSKG